MREDGKKVPPTFKDEVASGIGGSEAKLQHVKHQKFDQPVPSNQTRGRCRPQPVNGLSFRLILASASRPN
jgi:hypothetical protein